MKSPTIQREIDRLRETRTTEQLIADIESAATHLWNGCEKGSQEEKNAERIFCAINAILDQYNASRTIPKLTDIQDGLRHEPTGNEIHFTHDKDGYSISFYENGQLVDGSYGIGLDDFSGNIAAWVRRGYKAKLEKSQL